MKHQKHCIRILLLLALLSATAFAVAQDETFSGYIARRKKEGFFGNEGHVVGMTFQSALVNLGMRRSAFTPQIVLFDEAGQARSVQHFLSSSR